MKIRSRIRTAGIAIGVLFGLATGIGAYTFIYARGGSYLTNNPKACANCHIMQARSEGTQEMIGRRAQGDNALKEQIDKSSLARTQLVAPLRP